MGVEHVYINNNISELKKEVENKLSVVATDILEFKLDEDSKQVAVMVARSITKNLANVLSAPNANLNLWPLRGG